MTDSDNKTSLSTLAGNKLLQGAAGVALLLVAGVAGGSIAGFQIEPTQCDVCGKNLAACEAKLEIIEESLDRAEATIEKLLRRKRAEEK